MAEESLSTEMASCASVESRPPGYLSGDLFDLVLGVLGRKAAGVEAGVERSDVGILGGGAVFGAHGLKDTPSS
jgi:hypothetical protein